MLIIIATSFEYQGHAVLDMVQSNFLPTERLRSIAREAAPRFASAEPYPHVVIDDFFDPDLLWRVLAEFPKPGDVEWQQHHNRREVKLATNSERHFPPLTKHLLYHLNSGVFLNFLTEVTGIPNLMPDPHFEGGGMHQIVRGGMLAVHADFNRHPRFELDRRLNAIIYLNPNWRQEYGGSLELWDAEMTGCKTKIAPLFNRLMIFATRADTFHGHPDPLTCPEGMTRKSLALYYYTNGRPAEETTEKHLSIWRARPGENIADPPKSTSDIAKDWLPPVVTRLISRHTSVRNGRRILSPNAGKPLTAKVIQTPPG